MKIDTNTTSLDAQKNLNASTAALQKTLAALASGRRINSAGDDAAGLAVATQLSAQAQSFTVAERNANDGVSMLQTADGALATQTDLVSRMRELAMQSGNGSLSADDRAAIQQEQTQLSAEVDRVAGTASYNGNNLLASGGTSASFQVGASGSASDAISVKFGDSTLQSLGLTGVNLSTPSGATASLSAIDSALATLSGSRASIGASQSRLESSIQTAQASSQNLVAASSRIMDADMAATTSAMIGDQIRTQAGVAVLAQANKLPSTMLHLLG